VRCPPSYVALDSRDRSYKQALGKILDEYRSGWIWQTRLQVQVGSESRETANSCVGVMRQDECRGRSHGRGNLACFARTIADEQAAAKPCRLWAVSRTCSKVTCSRESAGNRAKAWGVRAHGNHATETAPTSLLLFTPYFFRASRFPAVLC
jgi:hypothetical protein